MSPSPLLIRLAEHPRIVAVKDAKGDLAETSWVTRRTDLAFYSGDDKVTLPLEGGSNVPAQASPIKPPWQRWNDYGIGCLIEGGAMNPKRGNLKQAEVVFRHMNAEVEKGSMPKETEALLVDQAQVLIDKLK